jgi:hypothetical protein
MADKDKDKGKAAKPAKPAKANLPKGFGFTLRGGNKDTMRVQAKYRGAQEIHASITHVKMKGEDKERKVGARAKFEGPEAKSQAEAWMQKAKEKLATLGWAERSRKAKTDAFDLESLPSPEAAPAVS